MPDFTVTIAGPERHEGHAPYAYVVNAKDEQAAIAQATAIHIEEEETKDVLLVSILEGLPIRGAWNDRRSTVKAMDRVNERDRLLGVLHKACDPRKLICLKLELPESVWNDAIGPILEASQALYRYGFGTDR